jgi:hypothetical protein
VKEVWVEIMEGRNDGVDVCMKRWQIMDEMHMMAKLLLDCVQYILHWPINWVIGSTVDHAMASSDNHLRNDWVVVSAKDVHEKASAVLSSSRPNIVKNILDKVDEELEICPRTQRKFPPATATWHTCNGHCESRLLGVAVRTSFLATRSNGTLAPLTTFSLNKDTRFIKIDVIINMDVGNPKRIWKVPKDLLLENIAGVQGLAGSCRGTFLGKPKAILSFRDLGGGVETRFGLKPAVGIPKKSIGLSRSCLRMKAMPECSKKEKSMTTKDRGTLVTLTGISMEVAPDMKELASVSAIGPRQRNEPELTGLLHHRVISRPVCTANMLNCRNSWL